MVIGAPRRRNTEVRSTPGRTGPHEPLSTPAPGSRADSTDGKDVDCNPPTAHLSNEASVAEHDLLGPQGRPALGRRFGAMG
eukprot:1481375-Pyramimonas_sp.AAC.1